MNEMEVQDLMVMVVVVDDPLFEESVVKWVDVMDKVQYQVFAVEDMALNEMVMA